MKKIQVLIVEDSAVIRRLLEHIIGCDSRLAVCGAAASAEDAMHMLKTITPDVIAMDIQLPGMSGLEATRRIMTLKPIPIVVVAGGMNGNGGTSLAMEALRAGALAVLEKPVGTTNAEYELLSSRLCTQLAIMSDVKLVQRRVPREGSRVPIVSPLPLPGNAGDYQMMGIVCSTGGPAALAHLLSALGSVFPLPILLVQHMTPAFLAGFASWLESVCPFSVTMVKDGSIPNPQTVHIAPDARHLRLASGYLRLDSGDPVSFQRPSGTVLFQSMAQCLGTGAMGLLLTGMGEDGAAGLLEIRQAGGYTIAEDRSTAVVYGMPAVADEIGAVCESLPLPGIAPRVLELVRQGKRLAS